MLWLALAPEKFPLQADTLSCAAGTAGKQKWSLILPSSARASELTYVTIVGTRYPELDTFENDIIQFGNYLQGNNVHGVGFGPFSGMLRTLYSWGIPCHIAEDTHITKLEDNKFTLTPRRLLVERRATASNSRDDVVMDGEQSGSGAESGWLGVSDNSSTDSRMHHLRASSVASGPGQV